VVSEYRDRPALEKDGTAATEAMVQAGGDRLMEMLAEPGGSRSQYERMAREVWEVMMLVKQVSHDELDHKRMHPHSDAL
jgi:hypothetical protein